MNDPMIEMMIVFTLLADELTIAFKEKNTEDFRAVKAAMRDIGDVMIQRSVDGLASVMDCANVYWVYALIEKMEANWEEVNRG